MFSGKRMCLGILQLYFLILILHLLVMCSWSNFSPVSPSFLFYKIKIRMTILYNSFEDEIKWYVWISKPSCWNIAGTQKIEFTNRKIEATGKFYVFVCCLSSCNRSIYFSNLPESQICLAIVWKREVVKDETGLLRKEAMQIETGHT